jgi:hypothetical protein
MTKVYVSIPATASSIGQEIIKACAEHNVEIIYTLPDFLDLGRPAETMAAIREADVLVAYIGGWEANPNVLLEVGYALGAGKNVGLVSHGETAHLPAALNSLRVFLSGDNTWIEQLFEFIVSAPSTQSKGRKFESAHAELSALLKSPDLLEKISPYRFELLIFEYLKETMPLDEVRVFNEVRDYDVVIDDVEHGLTCAIEVKKLAAQSYIGAGDVFRLIGRFEIQPVNSAMLITTSQFTKSAIDFAGKSPIPLQLLTLSDFLKIPTSSLLESIRKIANAS